MAFAIAGVYALSATGAFFTDTETSTGNTFAAGGLDLTIDSQSHYAGLVCSPTNFWIDDPNEAATTTRPDLVGDPCDGTWSSTNLGPTNQFFDFSDIKPGDSGEDTISMHVTNNAWICANITTTGNDENVLTDPEVEAGDISSTTGELAQNTFVFGWTDNASTSGAVPGDNIWQAGETVLFQPTALSAITGTGLSLPLADSQHGSALIASTTNYVGVAWCVGDMNVSVPGTIDCDGSGVGNEIQTDIATATVTILATQSRNNPTFLCSQGTTTGSLTVTKVIGQGLNATSSNFTIHVTSGGLDVPGSPFPGSSLGTILSNLASSTYTLFEDATTTPHTTIYSGDCTAIAPLSPTSTVVVTPGTSKSCTITNGPSII
jgi:predicted ribosomally synthesized peptide with SipW-like signal peptide